MKTIFRWLFRLFLALVVITILLVIGALLLKDTLAKSFAEKGLRDGTGLDARIAKLEVGIATPTVNIEGLKIYNPPQFGGGTLFEMPELRVEYSPEALRDQKLRFKSIRLNISEVHLIRDKDGRTNIEGIEQAGKRNKKDPKEKPAASDIEFGGVDTLYLTVGRIRLTDLANPRNNAELNIGLKDEVGRNLKTEEDLQSWMQLTMLKVLLKQAFTNPKAGAISEAFESFFKPATPKQR
jgi:uncharacterized protein involved in outer membrane biogenesis